jgi:hypothetical protein
VVILRFRRGIIVLVGLRKRRSPVANLRTVTLYNCDAVSKRSRASVSGTGRFMLNPSSLGLYWHRSFTSKGERVSWYTLDKSGDSSIIDVAFKESHQGPVVLGDVTHVNPCKAKLNQRHRLLRKKCIIGWLGLKQRWRFM